MSKASRSSLLLLSRWFKKEQRILPWRDDPSLYKVWISEIMLQQTQVATVLPFFERFIRHFPDVFSLAKASEDEVLRQWAGLGYYSRARHLHRSARIIVHEKGGQFPQDRAGWEAMPGVGPYTAGAILSIALNQPEAILDGNIERVLSRLFCVGGEKNQWKKQLWLYSAQVLAEAVQARIEPRNFNQALMELGARICQPKRPHCEVCPLKASCQSHRLENWQKYPPRWPRRRWVAVQEEAWWIENALGQVLLQQRKPGQWRAGLWDLPESWPKQFFKKNLQQKIGEVRTRHVVTHHRIERRTHLYRIKDSKKPIKDPQVLQDQGWRWVNARDPEVAVGAAYRKILKQAP